LIRNAEGFIRENARSFIILRVSGVSGGCRDTKSDSESSESSSVFFAGASNCPSFTKGSA